MLININIITLENIKKSYGIKELFSNINLTITDDDKIGLIGINGTGKTTLVKIISNLETMDSGNIIRKKGITIENLLQNPIFNEDSTVMEQVFRTKSNSLSLIRDYEDVLEFIQNDSDNKYMQDKLSELSNKITSNNLWDYESQIKIILTKLGINNFHKKMNTLSGGQRKRVALASAVINPCDFLILDEPTNHMDNSTIDWLENHLKNRKGALLLITHDRYFLDRVVNKTIELEEGKLYTYTGNYSFYIEKKIERSEIEEVLEKKRIGLYKNELDWMRKGARARTTKQKARIQRFDSLEDSMSTKTSKEFSIPIGYRRLGSKIIDIRNITKKYDSINLINNFSYVFNNNDRIGIIGDNGVGKSTFLNIIVGKLKPDSGEVNIGTTIRIAHFTQELENMNRNIKSIEYIQEAAEYITTKNGVKVSASQMMENFLFNKDLQWTLLNKLSGGEKRRLHLLKTLIKQPNVLIFDEPTNDLDLDTLNILEAYIEDFSGVVISVSHDRYFLDKTCTTIFTFEGDGIISNHTGNYSDYLKNKPEEIKEIKANEKKIISKNIKAHRPKFTYKEKEEFKKIDEKVKILENSLSDLETEIKNAISDFAKLEVLLKKKVLLEEDFLFALERQEYLQNLNDLIEHT